MGSDRERTNEQTKKVTTNTTTNVGDVGFTGQNAVDFVNRLVSGDVKNKELETQKEIEEKKIEAGVQQSLFKTVQNVSEASKELSEQSTQVSQSGLQTAQKLAGAGNNPGFSNFLSNTNPTTILTVAGSGLALFTFITSRD